MVSLMCERCANSPTWPVTSIENAIDTVRLDAENKGIKIEIIVPEDLLFVEADPVRLEQIIWNLLNNSVKFTPRGGRVQIRSERANSHLEIVVSDTGQGIAADFLPQVAQRIQNFRRVKVKDGRTVWEITADDAQYFDKENAVVVRLPRVTFSMDDGDPT